MPTPRRYLVCRLVAPTALLLALFAVPGFAQGWAGKGRLQGFVTDQQGKPVAGAKITLHPAKDPQNGPPPITTDKNGSWSILGLAGGQWQVLIDADGFVGSEGGAQVNEFGPAPALRVKITPITDEMRKQAAAAENAKKGPSKGQQAVDAIEKGNAALEAKNYDEALTEYQKAMGLVDTANQPPILRGIARAQFAAGHADQAIETLQKTLAMQPDDAETTKALVTLLAGAGRNDEAKALMAKLPAGSTDPAIRLNMGIKLYNEGKYPAANDEFEAVVKERPDVPDGYYYRGLNLLAMGKMAEAKADFKKCLELAPTGEHAADVKEFLKSM